MLGSLSRSGLRVFMRHAREIARDPAAAGHLIEDALAKAHAHGGIFDRRREELSTLGRLARAYVHGEYRNVPWASIVMALAAFLYFLSPIDLIPDFLAGIGLIDDFAVLAFVLKALQSDLATFRAWEAAGSPPASAPHQSQEG